MSDAYPVLTGETGTVNTGTNVVTLDDTTGVRDLRLFSAAVTAGSLADGDTVRVLIKESATKQAAWIATYDSTAKTLTRTSLIDAIGTLTNSAAVDVTVEGAEPALLALIDAEVIAIACSDETTALTTGTAKATFRMPFAMTLSEVRASVTTAPTGSALTVDINESGSTILSTKLTIDATEKTSETAATPPVISDSALADDAEITIDIDAIGSSTAGAGLKVYLIGGRT